MGQATNSSRVRTHAYVGVAELQSDFLLQKNAILQRLEEFASVKPAEYFYELAYCLLTPQSSAINAGRAVEKLKAAGFPAREMEPAEFLRQTDSYVRFHNTKGRRLKEAKEKFPEIASRLRDGRSGADLREWLVRNVKGLGWKEASHFLRNIGHRDLAILDRHILRNLKRHGVIHSLPTTLTPRRYLSIEQKFLEFSRFVTIAMDELDLLFWSRETGEILK